MATLVKIRGLDRGDSAVASGSALSRGIRGFRVKYAGVKQYPSGVKATATGGTSTNGMVVTAKYGGTWANGHTFTYAAGSADTNVSIAVTFAASTGVPTVTYTAGTNATVAQIVTALNANPFVASLYAVSSLTSGAGTSPVSPGALATGSDVGTGQDIYVPVNNKATAIVDVDDAQTSRTLKRNTNRFVSLGQV